MPLALRSFGELTGLADSFNAGGFAEFAAALTTEVAAGFSPLP